MDHGAFSPLKKTLPIAGDGAPASKREFTQYFQPLSPVQALVEESLLFHSNLSRVSCERS
jgi:hypothetical protein